MSRADLALASAAEEKNGRALMNPAEAPAGEATSFCFIRIEAQ
jgi:hypothetical protein